MNDERKKLMPEILPRPATAGGSTSVRQRVLKHMNLLIAAGATTVTMACQQPYGVVDPLPPPAKCRTTGSVLDALQVSAIPDSSGVLVQIDVTDYSGDIHFLEVTEITGGVADHVNLSGYPSQIHVIPDSPGATIDLKISTQCAGTPAATVRIVLQPNAGDAGAANYTVTTSDVGTGGAP